MITQELLKELLDYNPETGVFIWKHRAIKHFVSKRGFSIWNSRFSEKIAGDIKPNGYRYVSIDYKKYLAHRLAWLYVYGLFPILQIDHINGIRSDNRICNLREATCSENNQNRKNSNKNNLSSGVLGVHFRKDRNTYSVKIMFNRKWKYIGSFKTKEEADAAYKKEKLITHPFSSC